MVKYFTTFAETPLIDKAIHLLLVPEDLLVQHSVSKLAERFGGRLCDRKVMNNIIFNLTSTCSVSTLSLLKLLLKFSQEMAVVSRVIELRNLCCKPSNLFPVLD